MRSIFVVYVILIWVLLPATALSEYYQYTDKKGNLHFTDDKGRVPENQRDAITKFESVEKAPQPNITGDNGPTGSDGKRTAAPDPKTWDGQLQMKAEQLDAKKAALDKKFEALKREKAELMEQMAGDMSQEAQARYKTRIRNLNERIAQYKKSCEAFQEKVDQFNANMKQKKKKNAVASE